MFKYKNAMISIAVVAMLAACGGGGGGGKNPSTGGGDTNNPPTGGGNTVLTDADLSNALTLSAAGVLIPQDAGFAAQSYAAFSDTTPRTEPADQVGGYGLYGYDGGTDAPIESFAVRVDPVPDGTTLTADDTKTGRVAFQLQDQASVANGQILRILVSQVSTTVTAAGALSIDVPQEATLTVYAKNEAGGQATVTVPATNALFTVTPTAGSTTGEYDVVFNVAAAVDAAKAGATAAADAGVLASVEQFNSGVTVPFEAAFTMTNANIASGAATEQGKDITIGTQTVSGQGGISGYIQVGATATPETPAAPATP